MDVNCRWKESMDQKTDIDGSPLHLCSNDEEEAPFVQAFDRSLVNNPPILAIYRLLSRYRMVLRL
jgi:hypothetical protein